MSLPHQPHDKFFKQSMKEIGIARDFFKAHLPAEIHDHLDTKTLKITNQSYVDRDLSAAQSDIVYTCQIKASPGYIPVLFLTEHQSTPDPHMAFKLFYYTMHLMADHIKAGNKKLPIVLPLCVYHGKVSPYPYSRDIYDDFDDPALARAFVFRPFGLIDLTNIPTEDLQKHGLAAPMEILLKQLKEQEWIRAIKLLARQGILRVTAHNTYEDYLIMTLTYVLSQNKQSKDDPSELVKLVTDAIPEREREIMTFAQHIEQEGVEKGILQGVEQGIRQGVEQGIRQGVEQGIRQGVEQGMQQRTLQHAKKMLQKGLDFTLIEEVTDLSQEEIKRLQIELL